MVQVKLVLIPAAAAVLLLALHTPQVSGGVAARRDQSADSKSSSSAESGSVSEACPNCSSEEQPAHGSSRPARAAPISEVKEQEDNQEEDVVSNEIAIALPVLPPHPAIADDTEEDTKQMEPGQPFESLYKHGVAPAKLPAQENDNAHSYRHSIIHPYGDDIHA